MRYRRRYLVALFAERENRNRIAHAGNIGGARWKSFFLCANIPTKSPFTH
jgi:hypothetical protein